MHATKTVLVAFIAGLGLFIFLAGFLLSGLSAALASMQGSGTGPCQTRTIHHTRSHSNGHAWSCCDSCCDTDRDSPGLCAAEWVWQTGRRLGAGDGSGALCQSGLSGTHQLPQLLLHVVQSPWHQLPTGAPDFPQAVIQYGQQVCPGCAAWANGTYQCVSFVRGAYSQVYPMTLTANAFAMWALYAAQPGWVEIPSGASPSGERGLPQPGDVIVFQDSSIGHVAIVMSVAVPTPSTNGSITFSNANSVSPYTTMPLLPDLSVDTSSWLGYTAWGYIRPRTAPTASTRLQPAGRAPVTSVLSLSPLWNKETAVL